MTDIGLEDVYQLLAANYVMAQRLYDIQIALLQHFDYNSAQRLHDFHQNMQTLTPEIRLGDASGSGDESTNSTSPI